MRLQEAEDLRRTVEELTSAARQALRAPRRRDQQLTWRSSRGRPRHEVARAEQETLEFAVRELTLEDRVRYRWKADVKGVLVAEAERGGWAQMAGLRLDDLLLTVNDQPVPTVPDFERVMKKLAADRPAVVRLFVRRGGTTHFVIVEPTWRDVDTKAGAR